MKSRINTDTQLYPLQIRKKDRASTYNNDFFLNRVPLKPLSVNIVPEMNMEKLKMIQTSEIPIRKKRCLKQQNKTIKQFINSCMNETFSSYTSNEEQTKSAEDDKDQVSRNNNSKLTLRNPFIRHTNDKISSNLIFSHPGTNSRKHHTDTFKSTKPVKEERIHNLKNPKDFIFVEQSSFMGNNNIMHDQNMNTDLQNTTDNLVTNNSNLPKVLKEKVETQPENSEEEEEKSSEHDWREVRRIGKVIDSFSDDDEEIELKLDMHSNFIIQPNSQIKLIWDLYLDVVFLMWMIVFPLGMSLGRSYVGVMLDSLIDISVITDLIINFFVAFYNYDESLVMNFKLIRLEYIFGWFLTDFISAIPINTIINLSDNNESYNGMSLLRYSKLFKLLKLTSHNESKNKTYSAFLEKSFMLKSGEERVLWFILWFLLASHNSSCIWIYLGKIQQPSWIHTFLNLHEQEDFDVYLASLYFNWTTIFTIGYGDILSVNIYEKVYNIFLMTFGVLIYSFAVAYLSNLIMSTDLLTQRFLNNVEILEELKDKYPNLKEGLYDNLCKHIRFDYINNKSDKYAFIGDLPDKIKNILIKKMFKRQIEGFSFFKAIKKNRIDDFYSKIFLSMRLIRLGKGEYLLKENTRVEELILIKSGVVSVELSEKYGHSNLFNLRKNDHFGEVLVMGNKLSPVNLRVKSKVCDVYVIRKEDLIQIAKLHKDTFKEIILIGRKNYRSLKDKMNSCIDKFEEKADFSLISRLTERYNPNKAVEKKVMESFNIIQEMAKEDSSRSSSIDKNYIKPNLSATSKLSKKQLSVLNKDKSFLSTQSTPKSKKKFLRTNTLNKFIPCLPEAESADNLLEKISEGIEKAPSSIKIKHKALLSSSSLSQNIKKSTNSISNIEQSGSQGISPKHKYNLPHKAIDLIHSKSFISKTNATNSNDLSPNLQEMGLKKSLDSKFSKVDADIRNRERSFCIMSPNIYFGQSFFSPTKIEIAEKNSNEKISTLKRVRTTREKSLYSKRKSVNIDIQIKEHLKDSGELEKNPQSFILRGIKNAEKMIVSQEKTKLSGDLVRLDQILQILMTSKITPKDSLITSKFC